MDVLAEEMLEIQAAIQVVPQLHLRIDKHCIFGVVKHFVLKDIIIFNILLETVIQIIRDVAAIHVFIIKINAQLLL